MKKVENTADKVFVLIQVNNTPPKGPWRTYADDFRLYSVEYL